jgi:diguanylate cyclase (GGDEF)-like protein
MDSRHNALARPTTAKPRLGKGMGDGMKIEDRRSAAKVASATSRAGPRAAARGTSTRAVADTASVMGIPEVELTPKVRAAIMALMREVESLRNDLQRHKARLADLERLADLDDLVEMRNRRAFVRELARALSHAERYGSSASLLFFDLNGFKEINDSFGHAAGDAALIQVAKSLMRNVRESDVVGRLGGDEFGVILAQTNEKLAREKAESLADKIAGEKFVWEKKTFKLQVAYGVYALKPGEDPGEALAAADRAMYTHKAASKSDSS